MKHLARALMLRFKTGRRFLNARGLNHYLTRTGWLRSKDERLPVDADGNPLPWYTYAFIDFIDGRILPAMEVFEYGSGNSTLWWSERVASIVACEHDKHWYQTISKKVTDTVDYRYCELEYGGAYCKIVSSFSSKFDVVIIDGRDRINCAKNAVSALKQDGVVIWDNTERAKYQAGYEFLVDSGFRRIDFWGLGPLNFDKWCTSVFYRDENCLLI